MGDSSPLSPPSMCLIWSPEAQPIWNHVSFPDLIQSGSGSGGSDFPPQEDDTTPSQFSFFSQYRKKEEKKVHHSSISRILSKPKQTAQNTKARMVHTCGLAGASPRCSPGKKLMCQCPPGTKHWSHHFLLFRCTEEGMEAQLAPDLRGAKWSPGPHSTLSVRVCLPPIHTPESQFNLSSVLAQLPVFWGPGLAPASTRHLSLARN